jgi:hypothetical protein
MTISFLFIFRIKLHAKITSSKVDAPVASNTGLFFVDIFVKISFQVMSPDPIL